jgi:hypothetical protein
MLAKFLAFNLRRIVYLEHVLEEGASFTLQRQFNPLPAGCLKSGSSLLVA